MGKDRKHKTIWDERTRRTMAYTKLSLLTMFGLSILTNVGYFYTLYPQYLQWEYTNAGLMKQS